MTTLKIRYSTKFKKDLKLLKKREQNLKFLGDVVDSIAENQTLPKKYKNHALSGNYKGYFECHIRPDWLLIYKIDERELVLLLTRTGTHSDLFNK